MLFPYCNFIMTVNSSYWINPIIYSVYLFLYYSVWRDDVLMQKTYPLPASKFDYPALRVARLTWGAGQWPYLHLTRDCNWHLKSYFTIVEHVITFWIIYYYIFLLFACIYEHLTERQFGLMILKFKKKTLSNI